MPSRIPKNDADDCEKINEARTKIDVLLCSRESHVRFAQGPLDWSAESANSDKQSDGDEGADVGENERDSHDREDENDVNKLTNKKQLELALWRHGSNETKLSDGHWERASLELKRL